MTCIFLISPFKHNSNNDNTNTNLLMYICIYIYKLNDSVKLNILRFILISKLINKRKKKFLIR